MSLQRFRFAELAASLEKEGLREELDEACLALCGARGVSLHSVVCCVLAGCREGSDPCGETLRVPRRLPTRLFCDMPAGLDGWLRAFFLCAWLANLFDALAVCHAQGDTCAPPASYSGTCGSMSFKGDVEAAVLKCRSERHPLRVRPLLAFW